MNKAEIAEGAKKALFLCLKYLVRIGDCLSQLFNVMVLFGDNPNESVSGRAHAMSTSSGLWNLLRIIINGIFFAQEDHCKESYLSDISRASDLIERHHRSL